MAAIRFSTRILDPDSASGSACTVLPIGADLRLDRFSRTVDKDSGGLVRAALASGDFDGKTGSTLLLQSTGKARRVLLVGCGDSTGKRRDGLRKLIGSAAAAVLKSRAKDVLFHTASLKIRGGDWEWFAQALARTIVRSAYRYTTTLSADTRDKRAAAGQHALAKVILLSADAGAGRTAKAAMARGSHTGAGINLARELANLPGNYCTPEHLAKTARKLARSSDKASCKVLNEKTMRELGMGSLLSVTAGTDVPARLIIIEYRGGKKQDKPHVLVGKGITFDSGGISLKPGAKMDEMKFDMGGAASVLGTMHAVMSMKLPLNVVAIIAAAENMPSGSATKPGDVVTSMAGITIEVLNTDAEGRLVLCDALTYAERYKPASVVDIATLTGACVVALGSHASGLYANKQELADQLLAAGVEAHDRAWQMPLWDDYQAQLKSNFADVGNIGGPGAGSVTAACFLARFTKAYDWAHLDIAGSAWNSSPKGATGRPVGLLTQYLCDRAGS